MGKNRTQGKQSKKKMGVYHGEARVNEAMTGANRPMTARNQRRLAAKKK
jgi:hypothetical protein